MKISRIGVGGFSALAALIGVAVLPATAQPVTTTTSSVAATVGHAVQIAYPDYARQNGTLSIGSTGTLRLVGSDGGGDRELTTPNPVAGEVRWNPAGTEIAYVAASPDGGHQVWVIGGDGTAAHAVTPNGYEQPVWSPDGTKLAVVADNASATLAVTDLDAGTTTAIPGQGAMIGTPYGAPVWAPDGSKIAFLTAVYDEGSGGSTTINVVNADGTGLTQLKVATDGVVDEPQWRQLAWSPDGSWLAFDGYLSQGVDSRGVLQIVHPDGTGLRTLYDAGPTSTSTSDGDIGGFSPDGSQILLTVSHPTRVPAVSLTGAAITFHNAPTTTAGAAIEDPGAVWLPSGIGVVFCEQVYDAGKQAYVSNLYDTHTADTGRIELTASGDACNGAVSSATPRYAGTDRVQTAISVSRATFAAAPTVVVARDDLYPDALAAGPLASKLKGPLLLSPTRGITAPLATEVARLGAKTAYLIGDTTALSANVETGLRAAGVTTFVRIGGGSRYDTAAMIAEHIGGSSVYLARGDAFPDAASIAGLAAYQQRPIILVPPGTLSPSTTATLGELSAETATIVGGTSAVSAAVQSGLTASGLEVSRVFGSDRYGTSAAVATLANQAGMTGAPWLADGANWPDALSAGPAAAAVKGDLLLVDPNDLTGSPETRAWLIAHPSDVVVAVGGPDVVSPVDVSQALNP